MAQYQQQQEMAQIMRMIQGGMQAAPTGMGNQTGFANEANMNALAGQDDLSTLQKLAGIAPQVKLPGGF